MLGSVFIWCIEAFVGRSETFDQMHELRQADAFEVVALNHGLARLPAQGGLGLRVGQYIGNGLRQCLRIEKIDQTAVDTVLDDFFHRCGTAADDKAAGAHRFQTAPGKDKRVGEVDVAGRHLQQP